MAHSIVHVLSSFGMGGQERVALDLASGQQALGHRVLTISLAGGAEGPLAAEFRQKGLAIATVAKGPGRDLKLPLALATAFRAVDADVVHSHNPQPLLFSALAVPATSARLVHTKHGVNPDSSRRLLMRQLAGYTVSSFVAVAQPIAEVALRRRECRAGRLHVVPNGIDLDRFGPDAAARRTIREELGVPQGAYVVGTVGRLFPEKGHEFLIRSLAPMLDPTHQLVIAGDGPERCALAMLAKELGVEPVVHLLGNRGDIPKLLAALDLFVLTSQSEGLPLVIPEAMAAGLPVVATAVGGVPQVVDEGVTGHLVPYGDQAALRAAVSSLDADHGRSRTMGESGRHLALMRYSSRRMVADYLEIYDRASGGAKTRGGRC